MKLVATRIMVGLAKLSAAEIVLLASLVISAISLTIITIIDWKSLMKEIEEGPDFEEGWSVEELEEKDHSKEAA